MESQSQSRPKARDRILHLLKTEGPKESSELAASLGISAMAVRQHLYRFQEKGWVLSEKRAKPVGRPAKVWKLTQAANHYFPDHHNDLLANLMEGIEKTLGKDCLDRLIKYRAQQQIEDYSNRLQPSRNLEERIRALADIRSQEGYMAEVQAGEQGGFLLIENHCPISRAALACSGFCESELKVFSQSLGTDVQVERIEHLMGDSRRCVYRIQNRNTTKQVF